MFEQIEESILEKTTPDITGKIVDSAGQGIPVVDLDTLTLSIYTLKDELLVIRTNENVLNANGVTVDALGNMVWTLTAADTAIKDSALSTEIHVAVFEFTWDGGDRNGKMVIHYNVINLPKTI